MFTNIDELKEHYLLTNEDEVNLKEVGGIIMPSADEFAADFYNYLLKHEESARFFRTEEAIEKRKSTIKSWLAALFVGNYDNRYLRVLRHIGEVHVKRGIPIHWVTASMSFKREYLMKLLAQEVKDQDLYRRYADVLNKMIDLNLDVLNSTYHEEEIKRRFLSARLDSALISLAERVTYGLNLILVLSLIGIALGIVGLFAFEVSQLVLFPGSFETGILTALGTLLIIWVVIELMRTEINYLRGERFHTEIFVSVAMVAFIRELLIASLAEEAPTNLALMLAAILVLGIVYFLMTRTER